MPSTVRGVIARTWWRSGPPRGSGLRGSACGGVCGEKDRAEHVSSALGSGTVLHEGAEGDGEFIDERWLLFVAKPDRELPVRHQVGEGVGPFSLEVDVELGEEHGDGGGEPTLVIVDRRSSWRRWPRGPARSVRGRGDRCVRRLHEPAPRCQPRATRPWPGHLATSSTSTGVASGPVEGGGCERG